MITPHSVVNTKCLRTVLQSHGMTHGEYGRKRGRSCQHPPPWISRNNGKRKRAYIYVLQQRCHYMKIHSTFNHSPISKKNNSETSDTNQRSKIQRHYHTNTSNQPNTPNKIKKENQNKNVPRNLQSPHIPHRPRFHTHLRSISSHSRPLRVSHHPSHHDIPLTITSLSPSLTIPLY